MGGAWHVISARMSIPPPVLVVESLAELAGIAAADNMCCAEADADTSAAS